MKKRRLILLAAILAVALAGFPFLFRSQPGPSYGGKAVADWTLQLTAAGAPARQEAAAAFQVLGTNAVPGLIRLLEYRDPYWRRQVWVQAAKAPSSRLSQWALRMAGEPRAARFHIAAARAVALLGPQAQPAIPALVRVVYAGDAQARYDAAIALGRVGPAAVPALAAALDNRDRDVRYAALCGLSTAPPTTVNVAMPALIRAVSDSDEGVRVAAMSTFEKLGPPLLPSLTNALAEGGPETRRGAALALTVLHAPRAQAVGPLLQMATDPDPASRLKAIQALSRLGLPDSATVQIYTQTLKDTEPDIRLAALYGLNQGRWFAASAVPNLIDCLSDADPRIREWATRLLGAVGKPAATNRAATAALALRLDDPEATVRTAAEQALSRLNPP